VGLRTACPRAGVFVRRHFMRVPNRAQLIQKNRKNAKPSRDVILCDLQAGKNSNLENHCLPESPFTEMTYHVRGCMTSRLNELDSAKGMA
jgi:hypothetical protein